MTPRLPASGAREQLLGSARGAARDTPSPAWAGEGWGEGGVAESRGALLDRYARIAPRADQPFEGRADALDQYRVVDLAGEPVPRGLEEDRPTHREAAARSTRASIMEPGRELLDGGVQAQQHHAAAVRIALRDQRVDRTPLLSGHRLELPPFRIDAEVVEALQRAQHGIGRAPQLHRRNDLEQKLVTARLHRIVERAHLRFVLEPVLDRVIGMVSDETLGDVLGRPREQM